MLQEIRASSLARYMQCAGWWQLEGEQPESGEAAKEGTACGEYLEALLTNKEPGTHASNGVAFDEDMKFHCNELYEIIKKDADGEVLCETRIDWQANEHIRIRGQYDVAYINKAGDLCIDDLKYGWGIVEVKDNWQLTAYAIGEVIRLGRVFKKIRLRILQPRPHHNDGPIREWVLTYDELMQRHAMILAQCNKISRGEGSLQTGPNCKYCFKAHGCPALSKAFYSALDLSHDVVQDSMTDEELAHQLKLADRAKELIKIRQDSLQALAIGKIKEGKIVPGFGIRENYGHRKWSPTIDADSIKLMTGIDINETKMMSPAQAQKKGLDEKFIAKTTSRPYLGYKLETMDVSAEAEKVFSKPVTQGDK